MAISIDENILLFIAGVIFIPVFIFFIKMIMEVGNIKNKVDGIDGFIKEFKVIIDKYRQDSTDLKILESRLSHVEDEMNYVRKIHREEHPESRMEDEKFRSYRDNDRDREAKRGREPI